jgi:hypothetical protein
VPAVDAIVRPIALLVLALASFLFIGRPVADAVVGELDSVRVRCQPWEACGVRGACRVGFSQ